MQNLKLDPPVPVMTRRYHNAAGGPINQKVDYVEHTRYDDGTSTFMARRVNGIAVPQTSWSLKDAESLVSTGNWTVEAFDPAAADKPETKGSEVAW